MKTTNSIPKVQLLHKFLTILEIDCYSAPSGKIALAGMILGENRIQGLMDAETFFNNWLPRTISAAPRIMNNFPR